MKKLNFLMTLVVIVTCMGFNVKAKTCERKISNKLNKYFIAEPCTLVVTGNLHRPSTDCKKGFGICIKIRVDIDWNKILNDMLGGNDEGKVKALITINPTYPDVVVIDFLHLDDEQMQETSWDLEEDLVIDDPDLSKEPGGYKSIKLLKGNYEIDRSENKVGRCVINCKVN